LSPRLALGTVLVLCAVCSARHASAQETSDAGAPADERKARAAALDRDARDAFAKGDFNGAAELFAQANATLPHPATRYNEAVARQRAGQAARAANLLDAVVQDLPESDARRKDASARLRELSAKLGRLSVTATPGARASVGFIKDRPTPLRVYLEPGTYQLHVMFGSSARDRAVELHAGELLSLEIEPPRSREPPAQSPPPEAPRPERRPWGFVTLGVGAAAGVAAGVLGYSTLQAVDDFAATGNTDAAARDRAVRLRTLTNVALGACVVASAAGLYLIFSEPKRPAAARLSLRIGVDGARVTSQF
jgi:hypothetical protein